MRNNSRALMIAAAMLGAMSNTAMAQQVNTSPVHPDDKTPRDPFRSGTTTTKQSSGNTNYPRFTRGEDEAERERAAWNREVEAKKQRRADARIEKKWGIK